MITHPKQKIDPIHQSGQLSEYTFHSFPKPTPSDPNDPEHRSESPRSKDFFLFIYIISPEQSTYEEG